MDRTLSVNQLINIRKSIFEVVSNLSDDDLLKIPNGFKNNTLWNLGHIIAVQQSLHYMLSGLEMQISKDFLKSFRKGSSPNEWGEIPNIAEVKKLFIELPEILLNDINSNKFIKYRTYKSETNLIINNIDEALLFNLFHEGIHCGIILSQIKFLD